MQNHAVKDTVMNRKASFAILSMYMSISCILVEDSDELRSIMLEEEARQLRNSLINEKNRNARLMKVIEQRRQAVNDCVYWIYPLCLDQRVMSRQTVKALYEAVLVANNCIVLPMDITVDPQLWQNVNQSSNTYSKPMIDNLMRYEDTTVPCLLTMGSLRCDNLCSNMANILLIFNIHHYVGN